MVNVIGSALAALDIKPFDLPNYAEQAIPSYITKDNTGNNPITDIGATLGRVLFYDTKLSTDNSISCSSCHQQQHGFSDTAVVSQGVNGVTGRHSMRLVNARFSEETKFFWDERAETLEEQTTMPIQDFVEMGFSGENGAPSFEDLIENLSAVDYYQDLFKLAYGDPEITESRMQKSLAQFVRSIQSFDSKFDAGLAQVADYTEDFPNFTDEENLGKSLFIQDFEWEDQTNRVRLSRGEDPSLGELDTVIEEDGSETTYITYKVAGRTNGGFNCASCHNPPEFSIDPDSGNNAFVRPASNNPNAPSDINNTKAPTLRDVIKDINANNFDVDGIMPFNGGLFHSGQAHFLEDIFGHYEFRRLDLGDNPNIDPRMTRVSLETGETLGLLLNSTRTERQAISAFLFTLTGTDVYTNEKWSSPFE